MAVLESALRLGHVIETDWSPDNTNAIRAYCRRCQTWSEAWCNKTDYVSIRQTQLTAQDLFTYYQCFDSEQTT